MEKLYDIIFLDGRDLAERIHNKPYESRAWWEHAYLWFHNNFSIIMTIGGILLIVLILYNLDRHTVVGSQLGGNSDSSDDMELNMQLEAANKEEQSAMESSTKSEKKSGNKFLFGQSKKNLAAIKNAPGNILKGVVAAKDKAKERLKYIKSGKLASASKEKLSDGLTAAGDFVKGNSSTMYKIIFSAFMIIGFGVFFVPTIIMVILGGLTLMIFNKQKIEFLKNA